MDALALGGTVQLWSGDGSLKSTQDAQVQHRSPAMVARLTDHIWTVREQLVIRMVEENAAWGYRRSQGALANLGYGIDEMTVRHILRRHHIEPAPQRRKAGMSCAQFLKLHWETLAATDFSTVEVATWQGLVTYYVLVVIELATRCVQIAGITPHPTDAFMMPCAWRLTGPFDGFLAGGKSPKAGQCGVGPVR